MKKLLRLLLCTVALRYITPNCTRRFVGRSRSTESPLKYCVITTAAPSWSLKRWSRQTFLPLFLVLMSESALCTTKLYIKYNPYQTLTCLYLQKRLILIFYWKTCNGPNLYLNVPLFQQTFYKCVLKSLIFKLTQQIMEIILVLKHYSVLL